MAPLRRVRLDIAYHGAAFHGFAQNDGVATVAGTLRAALEQVTRRSIDLTGAGRTDAGVHARGQVVSLDLPPDTDLVRLMRSLNRLCGPLLVVQRATWVAESFDARFSATWRRYRYSVLNRTVPDPFLAATSWHVERPLDLSTMQAACPALLGEHDFSTFCKRPKTLEPVSLVREILALGWTDMGDGLLLFEIRGSAFCHNMVRSIVGTLVEIGLGRIASEAMPAILAARDRGRSGKVAPPHGLCFWEVGYDGPRRHRPTGVPVALAARLPGVVPAT